MSEYVIMVGKVVTACADKWKDKGDSNWYTNMYLDWLNNYITVDRFVENEIEPIVECEDTIQAKYRHDAVIALINLFSGIRHLQPMISAERVGEIGMTILKGEYNISCK